MVTGEGAFGQAQFAEDHRTGPPQPGHDGGIGLGAEVRVDGRSRSRRRIVGVREILHRQGDPVQIAEPVAARRESVGPVGLDQRGLGHDGGEGPQAGFEVVDAGQHRLGDFAGAQRPRADEVGDLVQLQKVQIGRCCHCHQHASLRRVPPA